MPGKKPESYKPTVAKLAKRARKLRLGPSREEMLSLKGLLAGALHSISRLLDLGYTRRPALNDQHAKSLDGVLDGLQKGDMAADGEWLAGYFYNSALLRIDAGFDVALRWLLRLGDPGKGYDAISVRSLKVLGDRFRLVEKQDMEALTQVRHYVGTFKHSGVKLFVSETPPPLGKVLSACDELLRLAQSHRLRH